MRRSNTSLTVRDGGGGGGEASKFMYYFGDPGCKKSENRWLILLHLTLASSIPIQIMKISSLLYALITDNQSMDK
jgi:hypothetical protein